MTRNDIRWASGNPSYRHRGNWASALAIVALLALAAATVLVGFWL